MLPPGRAGGHPRGDRRRQAERAAQACRAVGIFELAGYLLGPPARRAHSRRSSSTSSSGLIEDGCGRRCSTSASRTSATRATSPAAATSRTGSSASGHDDLAGRQARRDDLLEAARAPESRASVLAAAGVDARRCCTAASRMGRRHASSFSRCGS